MAESLQHGSRAKGAMGSGARAKGLVLGLIAGLVATIVIDLIMMGYLLFTGQPADAGFTVIGDTAAGCFSLLGIDVAGGVLMGVVWHYLIGLVLGVIFGAAVTRFDVLRLNSTKKGVALGIVLGFYFVMHAMWGILLGVVVSYGLGSAMAARQG